MTKHLVRLFIFAFLFASLAALPSMAQPIPAGPDYWVTPSNGQTFFEFPTGDVESLCGQPPLLGWNHQVALRGIPQAGADWDTVVRRLDNINFPPYVPGSTFSATTRVQVQSLNFVSITPHATPCGDLNWTARLAGVQPVTKMVVTRTSQRGGTFSANLTVSVEMSATDIQGKYVGSLFYTRDLPDSTANGTPWSWKDPNGGGIFRPGVNDTDNCIAVLRAKLNTFDPASSHYYWISDMIAQGICTRPN
ncbi:MAG: hypothetical protein ACJ75H_12660 [Thermoanaerobaculia bacterium]